jgi:hypothetical protein
MSESGKLSYQWSSSYQHRVAEDDGWLDAAIRNIMVCDVYKHFV